MTDQNSRQRYAFMVNRRGTPGGERRRHPSVEDPETVTRLLLGALTRGAMLVATSADPVATRSHNPWAPC